MNESEKWANSIEDRRGDDVLYGSEMVAGVRDS
jgi:hypothetical protein